MNVAPQPWIQFTAATTSSCNVVGHGAWSSPSAEVVPRRPQRRESYSTSAHPPEWTGTCPLAIAVLSVPTTHCRGHIDWTLYGARRKESSSGFSQFEQLVAGAAVAALHFSQYSVLGLTACLAHTPANWLYSKPSSR